MGQPAESRGDASKRRLEVVSMVDYLRETITEMDRVFAGCYADWQDGRRELARRLAALEASEDPAVIEAAADFEERLAENRPYESAEDAAELLAEAHRRYGT